MEKKTRPTRAETTSGNHLQVHFRRRVLRKAKKIATQGKEEAEPSPKRAPIGFAKIKTAPGGCPKSAANVPETPFSAGNHLQLFETRALFFGNRLQIFGNHLQVFGNHLQISETTYNFLGAACLSSALWRSPRGDKTTPFCPRAGCARIHCPDRQIQETCKWFPKPVSGFRNL